MIKRGCPERITSFYFNTGTANPSHSKRRAKKTEKEPEKIIKFTNYLLLYM